VSPSNPSDKLLYVCGHHDDQLDDQRIDNQRRTTGRNRVLGMLEY
jgi:hypothetical protein